MRRLLSARLWFAITAVLTVMALFVVHGAAGGLRLVIRRSAR